MKPSQRDGFKLCSWDRKRPSFPRRPLDHGAPGRRVEANQAEPPGLTRLDHDRDRNGWPTVSRHEAGRGQIALATV